MRGVGTVDIVVDVPATTPDGAVLSNEAVISSPNAGVPPVTAPGTSQLIDPNPDNNTAIAETTVTTEADLAITKTSPLGVEAGDQLTYTIEFRNDGPCHEPNSSDTS